MCLTIILQQCSFGSLLCPKEAMTNKIIILHLLNVGKFFTEEKNELIATFYLNLFDKFSSFSLWPLLPVYRIKSYYRRRVLLLKCYKLNYPPQRYQSFWTKSFASWMSRNEKKYIINNYL